MMMIKNKAVILSVALTACGCIKDNKPSKHIETELTEVSNRYCELGRSDYELLGYVHSKCDGAGFTSLYALMCNDIDLSVFETSGKLYRSPGHNCFDVEAGKGSGSSSESSRDMYLMRLIAAFEHKDVGYLERVIEFGNNNNWIMCTGTLEGKTRCIFTPSLKVLHIDALAILKGDKATAPLHKSIRIVPLLKGYQAHLEVIKIWLSGRIYGAISDYQLSRLKAYSKRENRNALFSAIYHKYSDGDYSHAIGLLNKFPKDRLPTSSNYCTEYLYQRDQDSDSWQPCDDNKIHSGTDFNFAVYVITH
jgi:hypothetical protein